MYDASNKTGRPVLYECNKNFLLKCNLKKMLLLDDKF